MGRETKREANAKNYRCQRQRRLKAIDSSEPGGIETMDLDVFHEKRNCIELAEKTAAKTVAE